MDIETIYAARALPRDPVPDTILAIIAKLKISFKAPFRRAPVARRREPDNWRESALVDAVRKVRERDDADYSEIVSNINKLSKSNYVRLMADFLERLGKRDSMFRLRVTTLLFDCGVRSNFFAPIMADAYADIVKAHPDALQDLVSQTAMFDKLYNVDNVTLIPSSSDAGYDDAIVAWTKQKEMKRGFAVYLAELYSRKLVAEDAMAGFIKQVMDELQTSIRIPKNPANEEHVDALVRFLFAVAGKVKISKETIQQILSAPKTETPSLNFKSRFKLEDVAKVC